MGKFQYSYYNLTPTDLASEVNQGKDMILDQLVSDKIITAEQAKKYKLYYGVIISKPSYFSRMWNKFFPKKSEMEKRYMMVKLLNVEEPQEIVEKPITKGDQEQ